MRFENELVEFNCKGAKSLSLVCHINPDGATFTLEDDEAKIGKDVYHILCPAVGLSEGTSDVKNSVSVFELGIAKKSSQILVDEAVTKLFSLHRRLYGMKV